MIRGGRMMIYFYKCLDWTAVLGSSHVSFQSGWISGTFILKITIANETAERTGAVHEIPELTVGSVDTFLPTAFDT